METVSETLLHPRTRIHHLLQQQDLASLLEMAGMLHGHYCPGLALGVAAVGAGFRQLGIEDNTGMEEIMAVAECNNCFIDGVQFAGGCSLGNNSLVYRDLGKTAVTLYRRGTKKAVRLCVRSFEIDSIPQEERNEGDALFEKAVKKREKLTDEQSRRMKELWVKRSFATVTSPAENLFSMSFVAVPAIPFAPIFDSQQCSQCGEKVMETKAVFRNSMPACRTCAAEEYRTVTGSGIIMERNGHS